VITSLNIMQQFICMMPMLHAHCEMGPEFLSI